MDISWFRNDSGEHVNGKVGPGRRFTLNAAVKAMLPETTHVVMVEDTFELRPSDVSR